MVNLETERLIIRNFASEDWEALHEMIVQYQSSKLAAYDGRWPTSSEEFKGIAAWFAQSDGFMAVCLKDSGRFIGFVATNPEGDKDKGEYNLGYIFDSDYRHKGYATEACRAVISYAFNQLQAKKIVTGTAAVNYASCRLLERLGFKKTGESTLSLRNTPDGKPIEFLGYSFTTSRDEWKTANDIMPF
ncbi:MAG: GNAT family N-acetyltransferase [Anaerolineae bacterium]